MWLSGLSAGLPAKGLLVRFPFRAHAWDVGLVPSGRCARGNHMLMFLSLFFPLSSPLSNNKGIKSLKLFLLLWQHPYMYIFVYIYVNILIETKECQFLTDLMLNCQLTFCLHLLSSLSSILIGVDFYFKKLSLLATKKTREDFLAYRTPHVPFWLGPSRNNALWENIFFSLSFCGWVKRKIMENGNVNNLGECRREKNMLLNLKWKGRVHNQQIHFAGYKEGHLNHLYHRRTADHFLTPSWMVFYDLSHLRTTSGKHSEKEEDKLFIFRTQF